MSRKTLSDWLAWQETLNPAEIDLGLDRIRSVANQLHLAPPVGRVVTIAGTNGKGSTASTIEALLRAGGLRTGLYTSPHLVRYNERVSVAGRPVNDEQLVEAFEAIEAVRGETPLTFFEYGTLAAMLIFSEQECDAWVLEIGLGGRLDAVNLIDPDVSVITTVDLDHQDWLGDTVEAIAAEKAGIMRPHKPVFYGDQPVPEAVKDRASDLGARLYMADSDFHAEQKAAGWDWQGSVTELEDLPLPVTGGTAQIRNQSLALAAVECLDPRLLNHASVIHEQLQVSLPRGRCQLYSDTHDWVLDVAHKPAGISGFAKQLAGA